MFKKRNVIIVSVILLIGILVPMIEISKVPDPVELQTTEPSLFSMAEVVEKEGEKILYLPEETAYIGVLEIPKIQVKEGFLDFDDPYNDVDYHIELLKGSTFPPEEGTIILAAHSGPGKIAYFNDLDQLEIGDEIHLIYQDIMYHYEVTSSYLERKNGTLPVRVDAEKPNLLLTTCSQKEKGMQLTVVATMVDSI